MRGDRDERAAAHVLDVTPPCAACLLEQEAGARDSIVDAVWAVVVYDCCAAKWIDHLVCDSHFREITDQVLPAECPQCGQISHTIAEIVDWAMTIGDAPVLRS